MPTSKSIKLTPAKGRPMLHWIGKKPLTRLPVFPAQHIESFDPGGKASPHGGRLYHGDNKEVLAHLLANGYRGKVNLIYIDPPFDSGADYVRKVQLRGPSATNKLDGEHYSLGEQIQYTDIWANDNYLQFMYERLMLLKELLAEDGTIILHLDETRVHHLRIVMDEVFGQEAMINEVIWKRQTAHNDVGQGARHLGRLHDSILVYSKSSTNTWNELFTEYSDEYIRKFYKKTDPKTGRKFTLSDITAPGGSGKGNPYYEFLGVTRYWRFSREKMETMYAQGRIVQAKKGAVPRQKRYLDEMQGIPLQSIWDDIKPIQSQAAERTQYPTQKPVDLLERILRLTSNPNDLVLDCFIGSGTTAAVAQKLGRRWIGADINKGAIQTTSKRLQGIIRSQIAAREKLQEEELIPDDQAPPGPAALSFEVHRVNDYDLQIQHNEAVALACEHIGVRRDKKDAYFDGLEGKRLVKVIPFNHPLSPEDLEQLKGELRARPAEERDILLIALGQEPQTEKWLKDWNRLRKRGDVPNKIEVIELRTDAKYGKFLQHTPCSAEIEIERKGKEVTVTIADFASPSILERLGSASGGLVKAQVKDWRSMVDCILIDANHDGETFQIALADHPEKKNDLVEGTYTVEAPKGATVAVKIIDMLGEELLLTCQS